MNLLTEQFSFNDEGRLLASTPAPSCQITITTLLVEPALNPDDEDAKTNFTVSGLAWGADQLTVTISIANQLVSVNVTVSENHWTIVGQLPAIHVPLGATVDINAQSQTTSCSSSDHVQVTLNVSTEPLVEPGCPSCFPRKKTKLLAGNPGRVVEFRSFSSLANAELLLTAVKLPFENLIIYQLQKRDQKSVKRGRNRMGPTSLVLGAPKNAKIIGRVNLMDYINSLQDQIKTNKRDKKRKEKTTATTQPEFKKLAFQQAISSVDAQSISSRQPGLLIDIDKIGKPDIDAIIEDAVKDVLDAFIKNMAGIDLFGIMFYDELHFRPVGQVAGESVYTLSLAPGEEVVLTEEHSSKKSQTLEQIRDRESERNLEFESSWTTDITQTIADELQSKIGGHLGADVTIPETPVKVDASVDPEVSAKHSSEFITKLVNEVSRKMATKMREQHKTTLTVSNEETLGRGQQRTVWNPNPARVLDLNYYKLYSKERVTLQRHDAKISLKVQIEDPGSLSRQMFLEGLTRLNPANPDLYNCVLPEPEDTKNEEMTFSNFGIWDPFAALIGFMFEFKTKTLNPTNPAADLVLSSASIRVIEWTVSYFNGDEETFSASAYEDAGGKAYFGGPLQPIRLDSPGKPGYEIHVEPPLSRVPFAWVTKSVKISVESVWIPEPTAASDYTACMQAEQGRLRDEFSVQRVADLADRINLASRTQVFQKLIDQHLLRNDPMQDNVQPEDIEAIRSLFEWNEAKVEYLPWWLTPYSREKYQEMRTALNQLPGNFTVDELMIHDSLTSARATVYLPIKRGAENKALRFIGQGGRVTSQIVELFNEFYEDRYGALNRSIPTYEQISKPNRMCGTPEGADDWEADWEKPLRKFEVLSEWSELFPTDGIHCEPSLSTCTATDEVRTADLRERETDVDLKR